MKPWRLGSEKPRDSGLLIEKDDAAAVPCIFARQQRHPLVTRDIFQFATRAYLFEKKLQRCVTRIFMG